MSVGGFGQTFEQIGRQGQLTSNWTSYNHYKAREGRTLFLKDIIMFKYRVNKVSATVLQLIVSW